MTPDERKSDTPMTDAGLLWLPIQRDGKLTTMAVVDIEHARRLERALKVAEDALRKARTWAEWVTDEVLDGEGAREKYCADMDDVSAALRAIEELRNGK